MGKPYVPMVIVGQVVAGVAEETKTKLEKLINSVEQSNFDIGDLLHKVRINAYYTTWGYSTFKEYTKTLKLKPRKAQYLARIAGVMDQVGIPRTKYEPLGIARLRQITSLDPDETYHNPVTGSKTPMAEFIKGFVEKGEEIDMETLELHVRTLKGFVGENDLVFQTIAMTRSAMNNSWLPAIELAKANIGSVGKDEDGMSVDASNGAAAEAIAISYLVDGANQPDTLTYDEPEPTEDTSEDIGDGTIEI